MDRSGKNTGQVVAMKSKPRDETPLKDNSARIEDLKKLVKEFSERRNWDQFHNPKDLTIGIVTEASELLQEFRFKEPKELDSIMRDEPAAKRVRNELADVMYFTLRLAQKYDIDITEALTEKIRENERKYPVAKARGSNKKYTELKI